jgi:hypothetical protein
MIWKPNTKYRTKGNITYYLIKTNTDATTCTVLDSEVNSQIGQLYPMSSINEKGFIESKPKKAHLPDWL